MKIKIRQIGLLSLLLTIHLNYQSFDILHNVIVRGSHFELNTNNFIHKYMSKKYSISILITISN